MWLDNTKKYLILFTNAYYSLCAYKEARFKKMESESRVQILDENVGVSLRVNALVKGLHLSFLLKPLGNH